jgi:DNA polymerase (family X)
MNNHQLAEIFTRIADLLEIKGEVVFKTRAYRRAAESLASLGTEAAELVQAGTIQEVPGIGKAIAEKNRGASGYRQVKFSGTPRRRGA